MEKILQKIGLSDKEIKIYLCLLEYGTRPASFLAQKTSINRATAYNILEQLLQKRIVTQTIRADIRQFTGCNPDKLLDYLDQEKEKLEDLKSDISGILPELEEVQKNLVGWKPKFQYFEGTVGARDLLEKTLACKTGQLYAVLSMKDTYEAFGEDYYNKVIQKRIQKQILLHVIRSDEKEVYQNHWKNSKEELRNLRALPKEISPPDMSFYLWDERYCAFVASKKENYGLLIESPEFYQTQKTLWNNLWNSSNKS